MKVLQILPALNSGGVERGTLEVGGHLVANGHQALVVSNGGRQVAALEALGARHLAMPVHRKRLSALAQVGRLRALLEAERPDILHIRSRLPGWLAWLAWRGLPVASRPRLVSTVHGFYSVNGYSGVMTRGEEVIAVSASVRDYVMANYPRVAAERLSVIHRGVDPAIYYPSYEPPATWVEAWQHEQPQLRGKLILLMPGRLTRWKGQEDFLHVVAALRAAGVPVHGLLAGEAHAAKTEFRDELQRLTKLLGLDADVTFLGHRSDLREVMAVSNLIFSLSRDPEAFGRVSLEAMALGKPVVAYAHGGVGEQLGAMFPDGLVAVGEVGEVARRSEEILAKSLRPAALADEFTLGRMLEGTLGVYARLLESPRMG